VNIRIFRNPYIRAWRFYAIG